VLTAVNQTRSAANSEAKGRRRAVIATKLTPPSERDRDESLALSYV
jgi:hypothetical protein